MLKLDRLERGKLGHLGPNKMGKHIPLIIVKLLKDPPVGSVRLENNKLVLEPTSCQGRTELGLFVIVQHKLGLAEVACSQLVEEECRASEHGAHGG